MTTTAEQSSYHAINEYVCDFVERHGECQATRDEASDNITMFEKVARDAVKMAREYRATGDIEDAAEELARILLGVAWGSQELELTCSLIAVELERPA